MKCTACITLKCTAPLTSAGMVGADSSGCHKAMANVKATMTDIRVIIRELSRGTSLREMERNLKLSRTSLRNYRDRAEASGRSMVELLALNDAELQAIMLKGDGHRGRDSDRYGFMQERVEDYARGT